MGQWIAQEDDPNGLYKCGDILTDQDERTRLLKEQRDLFDQFMTDCFSEPSNLMQANEANKSYQCPRPFWMEMAIPLVSKKEEKQ
jgi:hypothetical protein